MVETVVQQQQQAGNTTNGNVTALSVLQFVYGGAIVLVGLLMAIVGGSMSAIIGQMFGQWGETIGNFGAVMFIIMGLTIALFGVPSIIAATGLIRYKNWGRIFTLVMATIAGLFAVMSLIDLEFLSFIVEGGFSAYAWVMLTRPNIVALFRQGQTQQQTIVVETA